MRSFEERKAEIFKRSEIRIVKRKKGQKILTLCIPLVLCVSLLSVIFIPKISLFGDKSSDFGYTNLSDVAYTSLEVTNNTTIKTNSKNYSNQTDIDNAYKVIVSFFSDNDCLPSEDNKYKNPEASADDFSNNNYSQDSSKSATYTITFSSKNGSVLIYVLDGNTLTNNTTKEKANLTDTQLSQLKKALNLK